MSWTVEGLAVFLQLVDNIPSQLYAWPITDRDQFMNIESVLKKSQSCSFEDFHMQR